MKNFFTLLMIAFATMCCASCSDDNDNEDNDGKGDGDSVSNKEIVVKMIVDGTGTYSGKVEFKLDGRWIGECIDDYEYTSLFLTDYNTISFPKDLTVDWGDGTETNSTTHYYAQSGTYQITLKCKELRSLYIDASVKEIDLSQAVDLEYLCFDGFYSERLNTVDLSRNKKLKFLDYSDANSKFIDVSNNSELMYLACNLRTGEYEELDFTKNTELRYLDIYVGGIKSLNIKGCKELIYLAASVGQDEMANKVYRDLPQGKNWTWGDEQYSSYVYIGAGDISIAKQKGWNQYVEY